MSHQNSPLSGGSKRSNYLRSYDTAHPNSDQGQYNGAWGTASPTQRTQQAEISRGSSESSSSSLYANPPTPHQHISISYRRADSAASTLGPDLDSNHYFPPFPYLGCDYGHGYGYGYGSSVAAETAPPAYPTSFDAFKPAGPCVPTADLFRSQREQKWTESPRETLKRSSSTQYTAHKLASLRTGNSPLLRAKQNAASNVDETITRLETAFQDEYGLERKRWCTTHYLYDTCCSNEAPQRSKPPYVSASSKTDSVAQPNEHVQPPAATSKYTAPKSLLDVAERQTPSPVRTQYRTEDSKRRHAAFLAKLAADREKLDERCRQVHEGYLRSAAAGALKGKQPSAGALAQGKAAAAVAVAVAAPATPRTETSQGDAVGGGNLAAPTACVVPPPPPPHNDAVLALRPKKDTGTLPSLPSSKPKKKKKEHSASKTRSQSVTRTREAVKVLVTKKEVEVEVKWTRIDLSDDEDWERVGDEGAEWEVLGMGE